MHLLLQLTTYFRYILGFKSNALHIMLWIDSVRSTFKPVQAIIMRMMSTIFTSRFGQTPANADICSNNNQPKAKQIHDVIYLVQLRLRQQSLLLRSHRRHLSCPIHVKFRLHTQMRHLKGERENMRQRLRCAHRCKTIFIALAQLNFA